MSKVHKFGQVAGRYPSGRTRYQYSGPRSDPGIRYHKGIKFHPVIRAETKTALRNWMKSIHWQGSPQRGVQHTHYYRVYKYKGRGYVLFIGPEKPSHGGEFRHRPTRKQFRTNVPHGPKSKEVETGYPSGLKPETQPTEYKHAERMTKLTEIKQGRYKGQYRRETDGKILNRTQALLYRMEKSKKLDYPEEASE